MPIQHVVIIFKENHTFDNYFGAFPGAAGAKLPKAPDPQVTDPPHDHTAWLAAHAGHGGVSEQYGEANIPTYWAYAQNYVLCDNYFTDVASQSEPNHLHVFAANSPVIDNSSASRKYQPSPPYDIPSLPAALAAAGRTWRNYADANTSYFNHVKALKGSHWNVPSATFDTDVAKGFLPDVAWLFPPEGMSEHPGVAKPNIGAGMQWTAARVSAVASSPLWAHTAIFITWDDWGGWSDHVTPPLASKWTGGGPTGYANSQFRYGPRVPCLVLSPYARKQIIHTFYSHVSLVKFCLRVFGVAAWDVPALQPGDKSGDMFECFDFAATPRLGPPPAKVG
jgi:phospholipase C